MKNILRYGEVIDEPSPPPKDSCSVAYAAWLFCKRWHSCPKFGHDHAVLLRQTIRRIDDEKLQVGHLTENIVTNVLEASGLSLNQKGFLACVPYKPDWLEGEGIHSNQTIDARPTSTIEEPDNELLSEPWLVNVNPSLTRWKSLAQKEACLSSLNLKDDSTIAISLPTGSGKSLVFHLLAKFAAGLTVVIIPTTALGLDHLMSSNMIFENDPSINPIFYHSGLDEFQSQNLLKEIKNRKTRLLFTSPEACVNGRLKKLLDELAETGFLKNLVVDEAHMVDEWGQDFRVEFQLLSGLQKEWRHASKGSLRTFLLSATYSKTNMATLQKLFATGSWHQVIAQRLRPEMRYWTSKTSKPTEDRNADLQIALFHLPRPTIVYFTKPQKAEEFFQSCKNLGLNACALVTGNTPTNERQEILSKWKANDIDLMIATSAFGMGVDKQDVRCVVHACCPENVSRYYQEVGRGGRDGATSLCIWMPAIEDWQDAKALEPKFLSNEIFDKRWRALIDGGMLVTKGSQINTEWKVPVDAVQEDLVGSNVYEENKRWNKRLILMLARAGHIKISNYKSELDEPTGDNKSSFREWIYFEPGFQVHQDNCSILIQDERRQAINANKSSLASLNDYFHGTEKICKILRKEYGLNTLRSCNSSCRECRNVGRRLTEIYPLKPEIEYAIKSTAQKIYIVKSPHTFGHNTSNQNIKPIFRKIFNSSCAVRIIVEAKNRTFIQHILTDLTTSKLYRIDTEESFQTSSFSESEHTIVFHDQQPNKDFLNLHHGQVVSHLLPTNVSLIDHDGRHFGFQEGGGRIWHLEQWIGEVS